MKVISYRVTLLEPTLVTSLQGDPNSAVAFDYLPGSALRGILIGKYLGSSVVDISDRTLQRLFFDGTTRYLNGYPLDVYGNPSMPVPVSWQRVKNTEEEIFDFAIEAQKDQQQWQSVLAPFYTRSGEDVRLVLPARNVAVHTQRTARFGRAMPKSFPVKSTEASKKPNELLEADEIAGAVYRYDALASGQSFQAAIICDNDNDVSTLKDLISGRVTLGGSRSGGYGRAEIQVLPITDNGSSSNVPGNAENVPEGKLIVTLQSDVLLRDERGQFSVDPQLLCRVMSGHLGVELELDGAFLNTVVIGGFNRKWGLPLPQALAAHMGSVLIFKDPGCDLALLNMLEARGIGERRAEGFGCIAFNRQRAIKLTTTKSTHRSHNSAALKISETEAHNLAEVMVKRMLRQQLDESLLATANSVKITNPPSNAQLSRLRSIVIKEIRATTPDTARICQFIKGIQARGSARRQFERSSVNGETLLTWLKRLLMYDSPSKWTMDEKKWKALLHINDSEVGTRIGDVEAKIDDTLRLKYVLRLIDLVLAHATKLRGKEN
jgi:CRISPR-associated protein Csx10